MLKRDCGKTFIHLILGNEADSSTSVNFHLEGLVVDSYCGLVGMRNKCCDMLDKC